MSWGTCYSGSNNVHLDYPPLSSDGRNYTNWQPGAAVNNILRETNNIQSNWQYRQFLTHNASDVMKSNLIGACDACGYNLNVVKMKPTVGATKNTPFLFKSPWDQSKPYDGYENSDLKNIYLSRYDLQSRMMAPSLTQEQYLKGGFPNPN